MNGGRWPEDAGEARGVELKLDGSTRASGIHDQAPAHRAGNPARHFQHLGGTWLKTIQPSTNVRYWGFP
jgi:hypothetical protein